MSHWYDKEGNPRHFEGPNGTGTTLRQARKLDLYPSVTTIGQVKYKFGLEKWKLETVCEYALTQGEDRLVYEVVKEAFEELDNQAQAGTDIHAVLEEYFSSYRVYGEGEFTDDGFEMCETVDSIIQKHTGFAGVWESESRFCDTEHGFAGMCDLHNEDWIIDFKTKDTVDEKTRGWPEQAEQLAAYRTGLLGADSTARLANVFISREDPTQVVWFEHKDPMAWERFKHTLMLWQVEKKYGPYFEGLK